MAPETDEFLEKFQKGGGQGVISGPKIILQISLYIEDIFDSKIVLKRADVDVSPKICNMIFQKWGGPELFRKLIRFSIAGHP